MAKKEGKGDQETKRERIEVRWKERSGNEVAWGRRRKSLEAAVDL